MKAVDVMTPDPITVGPDTPVTEVARLLLNHGISGVPVVDSDRRVLGVVSEGDLIRRPEIGTQRRRSWWLALLGSRDPDRRFKDYLYEHGRVAADVMSPRVVSVGEGATLGDIAAALEEYRIKRVPVLRDGRLVGIVSRANLLQAFAAARPSTPLVHKDDRALRETLNRAARDAGVDTRFVNILVAGGKVQVWGAVRSAAERRALLLALKSRLSEDQLETHIDLLSDQLRKTNQAV